MPSACGTLTSARSATSCFTTARSIFSAASATRASDAAARTPIAQSRTTNAETPSRSAKPSRSCGIRIARLKPRAPAEWERRVESERQQLIDLALAVGERVEVHADLVQQRQVEVRERRRLRVLDMARAFDPPRAAAGDENRQV